MSQIIDGLKNIVDPYEAIFCDVWGVVHNGQAAFANAVEALMEARLQGKYVVLVTNSPKTPSVIVEQLGRLKVPDTAYDAIITAGQAMQYSFFTNKYKKFYFIGREEDRCLYLDPPEGVEVNCEPTDDYKAADVIMCAGPDYGNKDTPEDYDVELRQLYTRKLEMFCANPDVIVDHGDKRIWCAGALAEAYGKLGGTVYNFGKPFPPIYQLARQDLQDHLQREVSASNILFIGDGLKTDLHGAMLEEMDALFVSGGLAAKETDTQDGEVNPIKLKDYLANNKSFPRYVIGKLRW